MNFIENRTPWRTSRLTVNSLQSDQSWKIYQWKYWIIVKDDTEVFMRILHNTHVSDDTMIRQCKSIMYWPGLRGDLHKLYQECQQCVKNKTCKSKPWVEVHPGKLFDNFFPGESLSCDFGVYNGENILVVCDLLSGFMQAFNCRNQSTDRLLPSFPQRIWQKNG